MNDLTTIVPENNFSYDELSIKREGDVAIIPDVVGNELVNTKVLLDYNGIDFIIDIANAYLKKMHENK